jgi:DNA-binding protein HU-beta
MDVNRKMLVRQLADKKGYKIKDATVFVNDLFDLIVENIQEGNSVSIYGFGCFDLLERKAHVCPNRQLGTMIDVPAHFIPRFYPGVRMYNAVKAWESTAKEADD